MAHHTIPQPVTGREVCEEKYRFQGAGTRAMPLCRPGPAGRGGTGDGAKDAPAREPRATPGLRPSPFQGAVPVTSTLPSPSRSSSEVYGFAMTPRKP